MYYIKGPFSYLFLRYMSENVAIISDTHIPSRARDLPEWVEAEIRSADHTIHAGDVGSRSTFEKLESLTAGNLTAVRGDKDPPDLKHPTVATVELGGRSFVVTHQGDGSGDRLQNVRDVVLEHGGTNAIGVTGHTHQPANKTIDGIRILNPGSATGAFPTTTISMMRVTIGNGSVTVETFERDETFGQRLSGYCARLKAAVLQ